MVNNNSDLSSKVQTGAIGWMGLVTFFVIVLTIVYVGSLNYQKFVLKSDLDVINQEISGKQQEINTLKQASVEEVYVARKGLDAIEGKEILWSNTMKQLIDATPANVFYRSYSGNEEGALLLSGLAPSFDRVARTINDLGESRYFEGIFVPTVSKAVSSDNSAIVTFSMSMNYKGANSSDVDSKNKSK